MTFGRGLQKFQSEKVLELEYIRAARLHISLLSVPLFCDCKLKFCITFLIFSLLCFNLQYHSGFETKVEWVFKKDMCSRSIG